MLSPLAGSYGTHLALAYAREHPKAVPRMVIVGVVGPAHTLMRAVSHDLFGAPQVTAAMLIYFRR